MDAEDPMKITPEEFFGGYKYVELSTKMGGVQKISLETFYQMFKKRWEQEHKENFDNEIIHLIQSNVSRGTLK